jgi:hypothetical protein
MRLSSQQARIFSPLQVAPFSPHAGAMCAPLVRSMVAFIDNLERYYYVLACVLPVD